MRSIVFLIALCSLGACTMTPSTEDPLSLRLTDVEARLLRIERIFDNESLLQLAAQLERLQTETQALRGEIETLQFQTANAAERQRDLYVDLDQRLLGVEEAQAQLAASAVAGAGDVSGGSSGLQLTDQQSYDRAFALIQDRQYEAATAAFEQFLVDYLDSPLIDNAQYWLGETIYVQQDFEGALAAFERVVEDYPQSDKLADAMLKIGYCNYELKRWDEARAVLQRVTREYPDTSAARYAEQRLQMIEREAG